jgi:hypothetical protein
MLLESVSSGLGSRGSCVAAAAGMGAAMALPCLRQPWRALSPAHWGQWRLPVR